MKNLKKVLVLLLAVMMLVCSTILMLSSCGDNDADGDGNSTDGGNNDGDNTGGDNTDGGNTDGGNTDGGNTNGGNTDGGNTNGGNTDGGNTDGGNTDGGNTGGDNTGGDNTGGGNTDGGNTGGDNTDGGNTDGGNTGGNENIEYDYNINIKTEGGMAVSALPIYIYSLKNGNPDQLVNYGATDATGKATVKLKGNVTDYAVKIDLNIPKGYVTEPFYLLSGTELDITLKTGLVSGGSFANKTFKAGDYMYDFTIRDVNGKEITLSEELANNKVVILNFWFVDCSACQLEFPYMESVYSSEAYKDDVSIIALSHQDDDLSIRDFANRMGLSFNMVKDSQGITTAFGVEYFPTSVVIDRYGMISLIEVGALPSERAFRILFDYYISDDYVQGVVPNLQSITPVEKPDVPMPDSDDIKEAFGNVGGDFYMDPDEDMAWPFVIDEKNNVTCIKASNSGKVGSYAMLMLDVALDAGEALAFDYFSSCESINDVLYVMVDGKDIFRISGEGTDWETCYAYVAEDAGTYELALIYMKDSDIDLGDDTVYLKNLRIEKAENIVNDPTYIFRYASNKPNVQGIYTEYAKVYLGADGYYHVGSETGPLLLADLMGRTHFSEENNIYTLSRTTEEYITIAGAEVSVAERLERYSSYASNSQLYGLCPVTEELKALLDVIVDEYFVGRPTEDSWLTICCYYDSYGTDEELADPIKGLATFSAYDTILSKPDDPKDSFPNSVYYDRVIMPRGLFFAFTPTVSGVYQVTTNSSIEVNGWIFKAENIENRTEWIVYDNVDRMNSDYINVYMMAYLEAGTTYYFDVAYYDVYQTGTIDFRVDYLGEAGIYRFALASPGYFTYYESENAGIINKIIAGGIEVELGEDGFWREKRTDDRDGSILYADFTKSTPIFEKTLLQVIEGGGFDFRFSENDLYILSMMESKNAYRFYLDKYLKELWGDEYEANLEKYKVDEVLQGKYHGEKVNNVATKSQDDILILGYYDSVKITREEYYENPENKEKFLEFLKSEWSGEFVDDSGNVKSTYDEYYAIYQVGDVLAGKYHGTGDDLTEAIRNYVNEHMIKEGDVIGGNAVTEELIGCVIVTEELAEMLQMLMDKYTFSGVDNSWVKLCYYHEFLGPATPGN